jgi:aspartate-semialdehyde dehydrogenase
MMTSGVKVAVVEPTGVTGSEIVKILDERNFPVRELVLLGKSRSVGEKVKFREEDIPVKMLGKSSFKGVEVVFFASDKSTSSEYAPIAASDNAVSIDLSSRYALDEGVPLVVPEINAENLENHRGIIANPRGATIQLVLPLAPIHRSARIRRIIVSTYQAVSDRGEKAIEELTAQIRDIFSFKDIISEVFPYQIAFNALPHIDAFTDNAYTEEEMAIIAETRKILGDSHMRICATSVRVPVFYSHAESVNIETAKKITAVEVRDLLVKAPGVTVEDDPSNNMYPTPIYATGNDECFVGRIREDLSSDNGIALWIVSDNIRKGSALNAVQIAERLLSSSPKVVTY